MKKNQLLALLLAAVMLLAVLTGCAAKTEPAQEEPAQSETAPETETSAPAEEEPAPAEEPEAEDTASAVTLTDMTGREITLDAPAERVVALTASDCEILYRWARAICWSAAANTATIRRRSWTFPPSSPATTRTSSRSSRSSRRCCS